MESAKTISQMSVDDLMVIRRRFDDYIVARKTGSEEDVEGDLNAIAMAFIAFTDRIDADSMADLLNGARELDPAVITAIFSLRRECNRALADHPNIVCSSKDDGGPFWIGFLGLLNGMLKGPKLLVREVDDQGNTLRFFVEDKSKFQPGVGSYPV